MDLPAGRGTKRTKSTQIRRGASNTNKKRKELVESYASTSSLNPPFNEVSTSRDKASRKDIKEAARPSAQSTPEDKRKRQVSTGIANG